MNTKFKVGDPVKHKTFIHLGVGKVVEVDLDSLGYFEVGVNWPERWWISWYSQGNLELVETPIERMRRLYKKSVDF